MPSDVVNHATTHRDRITLSATCSSRSSPSPRSSTSWCSRRGSSSRSARRSRRSRGSSRLIALPYVGFIVFFLLGPRRIVRKRLKHRRARGRSSEREHVAPPAGSPHVEGEVLEGQIVLEARRPARRAARPPRDARGRAARRVVRRRSRSSTTRRAPTTPSSRRSRAAKHHVHVAYYIFDSGRCGARLARRARSPARRRASRCACSSTTSGRAR